VILKGVRILFIAQKKAERTNTRPIARDSSLDYGQRQRLDLNRPEQ
jgi:hypothetical protein